MWVDKGDAEVLFRTICGTLLHQPVFLGLLADAAKTCDRNQRDSGHNNKADANDTQDIERDVRAAKLKHRHPPCSAT